LQIDPPDTPGWHLGDPRVLASGGLPPVGSLELNLPAGWTKRVDPVPNVADPRVIVAAGTWDFPTGGECGPEPALADLPGDGALVWVDEYASPQDAADFESGGAPTRIDLQTPPARWVCA